VGKEGLNFRRLGASPITLALEDNATNYVEIEVSTVTTGEDAVAIWDTAANSGQGEEFIQNVDTVFCEEPTLVSNTTAFSVGQPERIPLATVVTLAGSIVTITDNRQLYFKQYFDWNFGSPRTDKTITTFKENDDALKTTLKYMKGTSNWYDAQTINIQGILERMNYVLVDGGNISWNLPKPSRGALTAQLSHPSNGIADGDTFTISDGVTSVVFEFDSNATVTPGRTGVVIPLSGTAAQVKSAMIAAINGHPFGLTSASGAGSRIELVNDSNGTGGNITVTESMVNFTSGASINPEGMTGGFSTNALGWTTDLKIVAPSRVFSYIVDAQVISILDGEVAFITLPAEGVTPVGSLAVSKVAASAFVINPTATRNYILAYRSGSKIYFGNGWQSVELEEGETNQLGDGISNEWLLATGLTSEFDSTPPYTSAFHVAPGSSFTSAISNLDLALEKVWGLVYGRIYEEIVVSDGSSSFASAAYVSLPPMFGVGPAQTYQSGFNQLEVFLNGRKAVQGSGFDWSEDANVGAGIGNRIRLAYQLPINTRITFRIQMGGGQSGSVSSGAADIFDEGVLISSQAGKVNFVGPGVLVTSPSPGDVDVTFRYPRELGRLCKNGSGVAIPAGKVVAWNNDGSMSLADANISALSDIIGVTAHLIPDQQFGTVIRAGAVPGSVTSLSATVGASVYLSETAGEMTLTPPPITESVIRLGRAEPADGVASFTATDLWLNPEFISEI